MLALLLTLALGFQDGADAKIAAKTPEDAFRLFLISVATNDEATLRAVTLPNNEFEWLLKGQHVPKDQSAAFKAQINKMTIKLLKPGDTVSLPRGRKTTVGADEVGEDRAVLLPEGAPIPTRCRKVDGAWKVDATPIIAGRKAADAAQKAAENAKSAATKKKP